MRKGQIVLDKMHRKNNLFLVNNEIIDILKINIR